MIAFVLVFIAGALIAALSGLIGDEARGWLALAPRGILWLVARRLPGGQRRSIYEKEWLPELLAILQEADGRPLTRLFVGIRFAVSMARGAGEVARQLDGVRKDEGEIVIHLPTLVSSDPAVPVANSAAEEEHISPAAELLVVMLPSD